MVYKVVGGQPNCCAYITLKEVMCCMFETKQ
jgi:hypothetical protein